MDLNDFADKLVGSLERIADAIEQQTNRIVMTTSVDMPDPEVVDITPDPQPVVEQAAPAPNLIPEPVSVDQAQVVLVKFCQQDEANAAKICGYLKSHNVQSMSELTDAERGKLVSYMKQEGSNGSRPALT